MRQERVARIIPNDGKLVLDVETETREAAFSKPTAATITRAFLYRTRRSAMRGFDAALRTATASGWRVNLKRQYPTYKKRSRFRVTIRLEQGVCAELCRQPSRR